MKKRTLLFFILLSLPAYLHAGPLRTFIDTLAETDAIELRYSSSGCFHHFEYLVTIAPMDHRGAKAIVKRILGSSSTSKESESVEVPLSRKDLQRLHALFDFYDRQVSTGGCTTIVTILFRKACSSPDAPTIKIVDSSCSLDAHSEVLSVEEIIERADLKTQAPNKTVDPTTTAVTPPAEQEPRHQ